MGSTTFNAFEDKTHERQDRLIRAVGLSLFNSVVKDSPVGNPDLWKVNAGRTGEDDGSNNFYTPPGYVGGRFRANWRCSLGFANTTTDESTDKNRPLVNISKVTGIVNRHSTLWLANSLPYAYRLEYEGHSSQAPRGMVRRNAARIKRNILKELQRIKAQT